MIDDKDLRHSVERGLDHIRNGSCRKGRSTAGIGYSTSSGRSYNQSFRVLNATGIPEQIHLSCKDEAVRSRSSGGPVAAEAPCWLCSESEGFCFFCGGGSAKVKPARI